MPRIAVIGGTRYVGRRVVDRLLQNGADVTLVTRGLTRDPFGDAVTRRVADAASTPDVTAALADGPRFDAVLHQVAYHPQHVDALLHAIQGRAERVLVTSTIEVYNPDSLVHAPADVARQARSPFEEDELVLDDYPVDREAPWSDLAYLEAHYGEGKRQVESMVLKQETAPAVTARLGHVLAPDDPTGRLQMLVRMVRAGSQVVVHRGTPGATSFVHADDAADALTALVLGDATGAVNVAPEAGLDTTQLVHEIAVALGAPPPRLVPARAPAGSTNASPFTYGQDFVMSGRRIAQLGLAPRDPSMWLADVVKAVVPQKES